MHGTQKKGNRSRLFLNEYSLLTTYIFLIVVVKPPSDCVTNNVRPQLSLQIRGYISYINSIELGYMYKIKDYIQSFSKNPICMFEESVNAFNK